MNHDGVTDKVYLFSNNELGLWKRKIFSAWTRSPYGAIDYLVGSCNSDGTVVYAPVAFPGSVVPV